MSLTFPLSDFSDIASPSSSENFDWGSQVTAPLSPESFDFNLGSIFDLTAYEEAPCPSLTETSNSQTKQIRKVPLWSRLPIP
jgi:hypothetical protein